MINSIPFLFVRLLTGVGFLTANSAVNLSKGICTDDEAAKETVM